MRYLALTILLIGATAQSTGVQFPPRYEMPPCGQHDANMYLILPGGELIDVMRIEDVTPTVKQVVGYENNRVFCDRMGG